MSIRQEMLRGVFWSAVEKYSGVVVSIVVSAVLARLIAPEDFGVVAVATVIIQFLTIFATMGIFPAIIQRDDLSQKDLDSIFTYSILGGIFFASLLFACSQPIARFYNDNTLVSICRILSINMFFVALNLVPNALMAKNKRFRQIAQRTLTLRILSGSVSVFAAFHGWGVYALLISPIVTSMGMFFINNHYYPCHVDWSFRISPFKKIFSYSMFQFLFEFINYFSRNTDKLIIGRFLNMSALGYYDKSYRLMMLPLQNVTSVINPVMQPVLACLQDERQELAAKYNKIMQFVATISFPLTAFLYFSAKELIQIVYGYNWDQAIPAFQILSFSLPLQMVLSTSGAVFQVANSTKSMFFNGLRNTCFTVGGYVACAMFFATIESVAWSWVVTLTINFILTYRLLYVKVLQSSLVRMLSVLRVPLLNGVVLFIILYLVSQLGITNNILSLCVKLLLSLFVTFFIQQYTNQYDLIGYMKSFKKK